MIAKSGKSPKGGERFIVAEIDGGTNLVEVIGSVQDRLIASWKKNEFDAIVVVLITDGLNTYGCDKHGRDISTPEKVLAAFVTEVGMAGLKLGLPITLVEDSVGKRVPMPENIDPQIAKYVQPVARNRVELKKDRYTLLVGGPGG